MGISITAKVKGNGKSNAKNLQKKALSERRKAQRIIDKANKRIQRLEKSDLKNLSVAYRKITEQMQKFSIKGKTGEELQKTLEQANNFLSARTSTIKGLKQYAKQLGQIAGIPFTGKNFYTTISTKLSGIWAIESKLQQIFSSSRKSRYYQYQQLLKRASEYVKEVNAFGRKVDTTSTEFENEVDKAVDEIQKALELEGEAYLENVADEITSKLGKSFKTL